MTANPKSKKIPHVGKRPRSRTALGKWRKKRSDAGRPRKNYKPIKKISNKK